MIRIITFSPKIGFENSGFIFQMEKSRLSRHCTNPFLFFRSVLNFAFEQTLSDVPLMRGDCPAPNALFFQPVMVAHNAER